MLPARPRISKMLSPVLEGGALVVVVGGLVVVEVVGAVEVAGAVVDVVAVVGFVVVEVVGVVEVAGTVDVIGVLDVGAPVSEVVGNTDVVVCALVVGVVVVLLVVGVVDAPLPQAEKKIDTASITASNIPIIFLFKCFLL